MLESRSNAQKTRTRAQLPIKLQRNTLAWWFGPRPGNMSQNGPKTTSLMTSVTKNPQPPTKKIFFECADKKTSWSVWALEQLSSAIGV